jgi:hypothetical protein
MAESGYAFIKNNEVINLAVFNDPSDELLESFKAEFSLDHIIPATVYADIGGTWDGTKFWSKQPYPSWVKNEETNEWDPAVAKPADGKAYMWDESTLSWKEPTPPTV